MINKDQIKLYIQLDGDVDVYQRLDKKVAVIEDDDWSVLDNLVQRFHIRQNNLASDNYSKETDELVEKDIDGADSKFLLNNFAINNNTKKKHWWNLW